MSYKIEQLLDSLCLDLGFCIPPDDKKRIIDVKDWKADDFACQVIKAEGMNPDYEKQWRKKISIRFIEHLGANAYVCKNP